MLHGGAQFVGESPVRYQNHTDHERTVMFLDLSGKANPIAFDVPIVMYQASYA
jgi:hypothetical protein